MLFTSCLGSSSVLASCQLPSDSTMSSGTDGGSCPSSDPVVIGSFGADCGISAAALTFESADSTLSCIDKLEVLNQAGDLISLPSPSCPPPSTLLSPNIRTDLGHFESFCKVILESADVLEGLTKTHRDNRATVGYFQQDNAPYQQAETISGVFLFFLNEFTTVKHSTFTKSGSKRATWDCGRIREKRKRSAATSVKMEQKGPLLNLHHEELMLLLRQREEEEENSKGYLMKWPVSV